MRNFELDYPDGERAAVRGATKGRADHLVPDSDEGALGEERGKPSKRVKSRLEKLWEGLEQE